jgi:hypothetical protein
MLHGLPVHHGLQQQEAHAPPQQGPRGAFAADHNAWRKQAECTDAHMLDRLRPASHGHTIFPEGKGLILASVYAHKHSINRTRALGMVASCLAGQGFT